MSGLIPCLWLDAEILGDHAHVTVYTGRQFGQDDMPVLPSAKGRGVGRDAGQAGTLIMRADEWPGFVKALAAGGHATGLRVLWLTKPDDRRHLWNAGDAQPSVVGSTDPVPWNASPEAWA